MSMCVHASQVALVVKKPDWQGWRHEMQVRSLGWEEPLEEGTATHSSILAWRIPWTETQLSMHAHTHTHTHTHIYTYTHIHIPLNDSWSPFGYECLWKYDQSYGSFSSPSSSLKTTKPHYFYVCTKVFHIIFRWSQKPQRPSMSPSQ